MKGGIGNLLKQAQQMQSELRKVQERLASLEVTGEAGAGMVAVTVNGRHDVLRVRIDPKLKQEDLGMLEDLLAAAVNDANRRIEKMTQEKMAEFASGLNLPPGFHFPT